MGAKRWFTLLFQILWRVQSPVPAVNTVICCLTIHRTARAASQVVIEKASDAWGGVPTSILHSRKKRDRVET